MSSPKGFVMASLGSPGAYDLERERGRAAGFTAGYAAGAREAAREAREARESAAQDLTAALQAQAAGHQQALAVLAAAANAANERTEPVLADAQASLFAAAITLAEAIIGRELADNSASARAALHRALRTPGDLPPVRVRLNPDDLTAIDGFATPEGVEFIADPTLHRGDAISEHAAGMLDARIATALDRARDALRDVIA